MSQLTLASFLAVLVTSAAAPGAVAQRTPSDSASWLLEQARAWEQRGRWDSAATYLGARLLVERGIADPAGEANTLTLIGLCYTQLSKPDSALAYGRAALRIHVPRSRLDEGLTKFVIGDAYGVIGQSDSGLSNLQDAYSLVHGSGSAGFEVLVLNDLAGAYLSRHQADSALVYLQRALPIARATFDTVREAETLTGIGLAMSIGKSQRDSGLASLRQALQTARGTAREALTLWAMGLAHLQPPAHLDSAMAYLGSARLLAHRQAGPSFEAMVLLSLGKAQRGVRTLEAARTAVALFDTAASLSASIRETGGSQANRISYAEQMQELHPAWALAWLDREVEVGKAASARAALAAVERGRARALLDLIQQRLDLWRAALKTKAALDALKGERAQRRALDRMWADDSARAAVGNRLRLPGADLAAEADSLVAPLRRTHTAALYYLVTTDTLVIWLVTGSGAVRLAGVEPVGAETLDVWVESLRVGLGVGPAHAPGPVEELSGDKLADSAARVLARWLLPASVLQVIPPGAEVVIVPQGVIAEVPFALLPVVGGDALFGLRNALRYAPSLTSLAAVDTAVNLIPPGLARRRALRGGGRDTALVVGNPAAPKEVREPDGTLVQLPALLEAEAEVDSIAQWLGVRALVGPDATASAVQRRLLSAPLVHLATHAEVYTDPAQVRSSWIALTPDDEHTTGLLTLGEWMDVVPSLDAELVVLSACQTGLGEVKQTEGTVGFQRTLLAGGARSVLVSLWSVSDLATQLLMLRFYTHWLSDADGPTKAEALRRAQVDVRSSRDATGGQPWRAPQYWAAFQLVGAR